MKFKLLIVCSMLALAGCQSDRGQPSLIDDEDTILVLVDGRPVTLPMLEFMMANRGISEDDHEGMRDLLEELIKLRAVANAAQAEGMDREPRVRAQRMIRDLETLQLRYFDQIYRDHPVTEQDIQAVYQRQVERSGSRQFQLETIVYGNQAEALSQLVRLEEGQSSFEELKATARATGLGVDEGLWVDRSQLPDDIAVLFDDIEVGEVVGLPLETPQGWRILRIIDTRQIDVPPLEQVREGIARQLVRQRLEALVEDLREGAEITPMLPLEEVSEQQQGEG
jgi:peptidyl-prolyl cis-trans isomerase C